MLNNPNKEVYNRILREQQREGIDYTGTKHLLAGFESKTITMPVELEIRFDVEYALKQHDNARQEFLDS